MIQIDRDTIIQVFGGLMAKPELLSQTDIYNLTVNDFPTKLDKLIFAAISNIATEGSDKIRAIDISNYLQSNKVAKHLLEDENGIGFLQDCETYGANQSFNYYYNRLKKLNLIRELQKDGYDVSDIYTEDILNPKYEKIKNNFEKLSTDDIINKFKKEISNLESKYVIGNLAEESQAADGIEELIQELQESPEVGLPLQGSIFNTVTRGARLGKFYLRSAGSGLGKALPNYTKIPTPQGWRAVGEIKVGDYLFDKNGEPTKVLAVYPQKEKKRVYKVHFDSGRIAECCDEHLWTYYDSYHRRHTSSLREMINKGIRTKKGDYHYHIPITKPVKYSEKEYSVDPYVMGLILGNGSFRYDHTQKGFSFSSNDVETVENICIRMHYKKYKRNSLKNYNYMFELSDEQQKEKGHTNVWVEDILSQYPELWNTKSHNKFIPKDYLYGSIEQRFDLLSGLMDTDGSVDDKKGRISYCTTSPMMRDGIIELCESLGMTCKYRIDKRNKCTTGECYDIFIYATKELKQHIFKLPRKKQRVENYINRHTKIGRIRDWDAIVDIEKTNIFTDMTCFYVDNPDHLFLMNDFIVTHNTRSMVGDACLLAYPIRYNSQLDQWMSTGCCEKVLYVMTEQDPEEIKTMILAYLTDIDEQEFLYGTFDHDGQMDRIKIAIEIMEKYKDNMNFAHVPDPSPSIVKSLFRKYNLQHQVNYFFYDYIFSSPNMLNEYRDLGLNESVLLRLFATTLKNLSVELNAFVLSSTQVSYNQQQSASSSVKDVTNIRGSRAIVDTADVGCFMSTPTQEELQQITKMCENQMQVVPNCVIDIYKNRRGRYKDVRIWCYNDLSRCRRVDLFITDKSGKIVDDYIPMETYSANVSEYSDMVKEYNKRCKRTLPQTNIEVAGKPVEEPKLFSDTVRESGHDYIDEDVFDSFERDKERLKDQSLSDLI